MNKKRKYVIMLITSTISIIILLLIYLTNLIKANQEKNFSEKIISNYKVYKLYANDNTNQLLKDNDIYGNIIIPKLNINYPFFYGISDDLLKISPCRFYGNITNQTRNQWQFMYCRSQL